MAAIKILLIEDDEDYIFLTKDLLEETGLNFELDTATTSKDGLEKLKNQSYDCVLADYIIPGITGLEVMFSTRKMQIDTPFILLTGFGDNDFGQDLIEKGAFHFFTKSELSAKGLKEKIQQALVQKVS